jgi:sigma-E factor negative regulatory protein RseA
MTDQIREQLSAFLDGELPRDEIGLLLRRLERDAELRRAFGSYSLIGESLRAPGGRVASPAFAARVSAGIGGAVAEAAPVAKSHPVFGQPPGFWKRPAIRTALAASAAATAVFFIRPDASREQVAVQRPAEVIQFAPAYTPTPAQAQRLASYMVAHSQYSTPMVRRNVLTGLLAADPALTTVSYDMGETP